MNISEAEQLARAAIRNDVTLTLSDQLRRRLVWQGGKEGDAWVFTIGVLPAHAQTFEEFLVSPNVSDAATDRAEDWIQVRVDSSGECTITVKGDPEDFPKPRTAGTPKQ